MTAPSSGQTAELLRHEASKEGFQLCGICPAVDSTGFNDLVDWIDSGYAAEMTYIQDRLDAYRHPEGVLEGVRSIIALAMPYPNTSGPNIPGSIQKEVDSVTGKVARYAWPGTDYHDIIHPKLKRLIRIISEQHPDSKSRGVVDTAPLMEREIAQLSGLGWRAKNTLLIRPGIGSYFFLACILTDVVFPYDEPFSNFHCGSCTACLDACPTDALIAPTETGKVGAVDASRCISYLTIEHRGPIDVELRPKIGSWVFGCDICQEVCPWNDKPSRQVIDQDDFPLQSLPLHELFDLTEADFRQKYRKTPLWRTRRRGVLRNAAIVLGNQEKSSSYAALCKGLQDHEPIVRGASAWALGRLPVKTVMVLQERLLAEDDSSVRHEINEAVQYQNKSGV